MSLFEEIEKTTDVLNDLVLKLESKFHNEFMKDLSRSSVEFVSFGKNFDEFVIFLDNPALDTFEYENEDGSGDIATIDCSVDYFFESVLERLNENRHLPDLYENFRLKVLKFAERIEQLKDRD